MLLVILGAGASYDSAPSRHPRDARYREMPNRPPLGNELFGDRQDFGEVMNKYWQCLPIIPRLRHIPTGSTVEAMLQDLETQATHNPDRHPQLAAIRYYLQEILWVTTERWLEETKNLSNHRTLVDDIKQWKKPDEKVCFVTFNYDTLLDQALSDRGHRFTELSDYIARDLMLVKLHGSVNWVRIVTAMSDEDQNVGRTDLARRLIEDYANLKISRKFVLAGEYPPSPRNKRPVVPALAIPVEGKLDFECPSEHVEALKAFVPEVRKILMIGWRATEQPFLEILKHGLGQANPHIMVVNGSEYDAEDAANRIRRAEIPAHYSITPDGFTDFIISNRAREFLNT